MKRLILLTGIAGLMLFMACGQMAGNNPVGVTGGGDNGYGTGWSGLSGRSGDDYNPGNQLLGSWERTIDMDTRQIVTFYSDGEMDWRWFVNGVLTQFDTGNYFVSGNVLTIVISDETFTGLFSIQGNTLTIDLGGETMVWHRI